uniref:Uncharacterized protein n=1 Tax=Romanomermis culicivorax TaxID=13658 RepID=A0A915IRA4_ROMCU
MFYPPDSANRIYPTILQIALTTITRDEVLTAYKVFMYDCTSSNHGQSYCLAMVPNTFRSVKVLTCTTHRKLLTAPKVPKKKKKKQKDEWIESLDVSDDEDLAL